jgi:chemotaxis protein CheX
MTSVAPDAADVEDVVRSVWVTLSDRPLERARDRTTGLGGGLTGVVRIDGAWTGAVAVECSAPLAAALATQMMRGADPSAEDVRDGLGEIANMVAGNVKALLPQPAHISLPSVTADPSEARLGGAAVVVTVPFSSDGEPLVVTVLERR